MNNSLNRNGSRSQKLKTKPINNQDNRQNNRSRPRSFVCNEGNNNCNSGYKASNRINNNSKMNNYVHLTNGNTEESQESSFSTSSESPVMSRSTRKFNFLQESQLSREELEIDKNDIRQLKQSLSSLNLEKNSILSKLNATRDKPNTSNVENSSKADDESKEMPEDSTENSDLSKTESEMPVTTDAIYMNGNMDSSKLPNQFISAYAQYNQIYTPQKLQQISAAPQANFSSYPSQYFSHSMPQHTSAASPQQLMAFFNPQNAQLNAQQFIRQPHPASQLSYFIMNPTTPNGIYFHTPQTPQQQLTAASFYGAQQYRMFAHPQQQQPQHPQQHQHFIHPNPNTSIPHQSLNLSHNQFHFYPNSQIPPR